MQMKQMALQMDQMKQQQRTQEFTKDLQYAKTMMEYAGTKGVSNDSQAQLVNNANQIMSKWYPNMKFPQLTPETMADYAQVLRQGTQLLSHLQKDPSKWDFIRGEWGKLNAQWDADNAKQAQLTDMQKYAREDVTKTMAAMGENYMKQQEVNKKGSGKSDTPSPQEAFKRISEIQGKLGSMNQLDQETANLIKIAPEAADELVGRRMTPEMMGQIQGAAVNEIEYLNQFIPEEQRLQAITPEERQALQQQGFSPDEIGRKYYVKPQHIVR
jgi:hypothetical protein